jgi:hypothetical protein
VLLLAALVTQAASWEVPAIEGAAQAVSYEGARGLLRLRGRHVRQRIYLAEADGLDFVVTADLDAWSDAS